MNILRRAALLAMSFLALTGRAVAAELTIRVGASPSKGGIVVMLFDSAEGFEGFRAPVRAESFAADAGTELKLKDVSAGTYALVVFNDENDNRRLDVNFIGIPKEPIGFSNQYRPRGPPGFDRASFRIEPNSFPVVDVMLARPLGERGRLGIGAGVIARDSPYKESDGNPAQFIPAVIYIGNRLQILGPFAQLGLAGGGNSRLAATLAYRMRAYESSDGVALAGMAGRKATLMAGLRLQWDVPGGVDVQAGYAHDMLDRIGGGQAQAGISRPVPWRSFRATPALSVNWTSAGLMRHDFGVTPAEATPQRPGYSPGSAFSAEAGISFFAEITPSLSGVLNVAVEWFDDDARRSPIVDDGHVIKGHAFLTYML